MDISYLEEHGEIHSPMHVRKLVSTLTLYSNRNSNFFNTKIYYYSKDSKSVKDFTKQQKSDSVLKIVKYYNTRSFFLNAWCFSFVWENEKWKGTFVSNHSDLFNYNIEMLNGKNPSLSLLPLPKPISIIDVFSSKSTNKLSKDVYYMLKSKCEWESNGGINAIKKFIRQLLFIMRYRTSFTRSVPKDTHFISSSRKTVGVINTGLVDKKGEHIYIEATQVAVQSDLNEHIYTFSKVRVVETVPHLKLKPFSVLNCVQRRKLDLNAITLDYQHGLDHISFGRSHRLDTEAELSVSRIKKSIIKSIQLAVTKGKQDTSHIASFVSMKYFKESFLVPLYLDGIEKGKPLGAIIITDIVPGVWVPATVLELKTAWSDARLVSTIKADWLEVSKCA